MNRKTYLICPDDVKASSIVNYNVNEEDLSDCIRKAQTIYLREIIGDNLLERVQELVETGEIELPENEKYLELLDNYIGDYLANKAIVELCPVISFKIRNIGIAQDNDTNINSSAKQDIMDLADFFQTRACDSANRMIDFINEVGFEEVKTVCICGKKQANLKKQANTSLYMD